MATATLPPNHRVRQIAILVSSVEAAVARQLLLHLPTETARQVRAMVGQLGTVTPAERRAILNEFQKTATRTTAPSAERVSNAGHAGQEASSEPSARQETALGTAGAERHRELQELEAAPAWTKLSTPALVRFVKGERIAVAAVVISRLPPGKGVDVLQQLPREMHREVLRRISQLQDVDPSAMSAIEEHLVERLSEYQQLIESEQANLRRLTALLAAAPPELQQEWQQALREPEPEAVPAIAATPAEHPVTAVTSDLESLSPGHVAHAPVGNEADMHRKVDVPETDAATLGGRGQTAGKTPLVTASRREMAQATIAELYGDSVFTAAAGVQEPATSPPQTFAAAPPAIAPSDNASAGSDVADVLDLNSTNGSGNGDANRGSADALAGNQHSERPQTLSFADAARSRHDVSGPRATGSDVAVDLHPLLSLSSGMLAQILSNVEARTVLLALAGSSPNFMRRFSDLLEPRDARALNQRLQNIGAINLREVDEAQRHLLRVAAPFLDAVHRSQSRAA